METIDVILLVTSGLLILSGIVGSVLPALPGPPIAYAGLLITHFFTPVSFSILSLVIYGIFTIIIVAVDYWIPAYWVKKTGGTKWGSYGSIIGMLVGILFFPPLGMLIGTFLGAVIGELMAGKDNDAALKSGIATFFGFLAGAFLKVVFCLVMLVHFVIVLF
jgi:uncharacterized protein